VTVGAQRICQAPGIMAVSLGAAGMFALAVTTGTHGVDGIHRRSAVDDLLDDHAEARLDGDAEPRIGGSLLLPQSPTRGAVLDLEVGDEGAAGINDDDVVMIAGPVEAGEVAEFCMRFHRLWFPGFGGLRPAATAGSCCYGSFESMRSIRPWGGGLRTGRCPTLNLREMSETRPCRVRGVAAIDLRRRG